MTQIFFTEPGHQDLLNLEHQTRERVKAKLRATRTNPDRYLHRLQGHDVYVLRVGDYRVFADWDRTEDAIYVHAIGHRRNAYDRAL